MRVAAGGADLLLGCDLVVAARQGRAGSRCTAPRPASSSTATPSDRRRRFHAQPRLRAADRSDCSARSRPRRRRGATLIDATALAVGADRQCHRRQPVHARLCLSVRLRAAHRSPRSARDRTQRRRGRRSTGRVSAGAAAPAHDRRQVGGLVAQPASAAPDSAEPSARGAGRAPRRFPESLSESRLRDALSQLVDAVSHRGSREARPGRSGFADGRGAQSVQADGLQGRIRGRAALYRRLVPGTARAHSSMAICASNSISPRRCWRARIHATGEAKKMRFGPWMMQGFHSLAALRGLRGTRFDIFGRTAERREERALIGEYEALLRELIATLTSKSCARGLARRVAGEDSRLRSREDGQSRQGARGVGAADRDMARAGAEATGGGVRGGGWGPPPAVVASSPPASGRSPWMKRVAGQSGRILRLSV